MKCAAGLLILIFTAPLCAEDPRDPEIGYVFPAGGPAGSSIDVKIGIYDGTPDLDYLVLDPRIKLEILGPPGKLFVPERPFATGQRAYHPEPLPREVPARFHIPADYPPGRIRFQVASANGASRVASFIVGEGSEVVEDEECGSPQRIESLPVFISGRLLRNEEVDRYIIRAQNTEPVTCTLYARRLGSRIGGVIEVFDQSGRLVADAVDSRGLDTALTFSAVENQEYTIAVRDLDFRGNRSFVYRLAIEAGPRVIAAFPSFGKPGTVSDIEFIGYGVSTGAAKVERRKQSVRFPTVEPGHLFHFRLETPFGTASAVPLQLSRLPAQTRVAAADADRVAAGFSSRDGFYSKAAPVERKEAAFIAVPGAISDEFDSTTHQVRYKFQSRQGERWNVRAEAATFEIPVDPAIMVFDWSGTKLAENDDLPETTSAGLEFETPSEGTYVVVVRNQSRDAASTRNLFHLAVDRAVPDFSLSSQQRVAVVPGGSAELVVTARRRGGFDGPIRLRCSQLPEGTSVPLDLVIPAGATELRIPMSAAENAPTGACHIAVTGFATIGDENVSRPVLARIGDNLAPTMPAEVEIPQILLAVVMKPRVRIWPVESDERTVHRGSTHLAEIGIERLEGFAGEVLVQLESRQPHKFRQGVLGPDVVVPSDQSRVLYPCHVPEILETLDAYRVAASAMVAVPDARGRPRWLLSKMPSTISIAITVEGGLMKLTTEAPRINVEGQTRFQVPLKLVRSTRLVEATTIECILPSELVGLVGIEPMTIAADRETCDFPVTVLGNVPPGRYELCFRATTTEPGEVPPIDDSLHASPLDEQFLSQLRNDRLPIISQAEAVVDFQAAP